MEGANWMEPCAHQDIATLGGVGAKMNRPIGIRTTTACEYLQTGIRRGTASFAKIEQKVGPIIEDVRRRGDQAVLDYTAKFDGADSVPDSIEVASVDIDRAYSIVDEGIVRALRKAADNIRRFHERQVQQTSVCILDDGTMMGQIIRPIERVGLYVPGGAAAYPSSVLMGAIPARVAGVSSVIACTPPGPGGAANPYVLVAADIAGVDRVFKVGGCQAIAAMAFGTETICAVDKIAGPGNAYVTAAKRLVFGYVDIDMLAGPSELMVLADKYADPSFAAADLLSQAEHGPDSEAILVTTSRGLAVSVAREINCQIESLSRRNTIAHSLSEHGLIVIADDLDQAIDVVNSYAPEHLEVLVDNPHAILGRLRNAGSILLGPLTPVAATDYAAGPNHVLPTGGTARSQSPLSVRDFVKIQNVTSLTRASLDDMLDAAETVARVEGLDAHAAALVARRINCNDCNSSDE